MSIDQLYTVVMNEVVWQNFCSTAAMYISIVVVIAGIFVYRHLKQKIDEQNQIIDDLVNEVVNLDDLVYRD